MSASLLDTKRRCRTCGAIYSAYDAHPCFGGSDPYTEPPNYHAALVRQLDEQAAALARLPSMLRAPPMYNPGLSDTDIARIADAVAERLRPSVLDVTPDEVRRWMGGRRV